MKKRVQHMKRGRIKDIKVFLETVHWILLNICGETQIKNGIPFHGVFVLRLNFCK